MCEDGWRPNRKNHIVTSPAFKGFSGDEKTIGIVSTTYNDTNFSKSRYFDIDIWAEKHGLLQFPKASKSERNEGCEGLPYGEAPASARSKPAEGRENALGNPRQNHHPTVKPVHLMAWLIRLISKQGDIILDPFTGSGTTGVACRKLGRKFVGIELNEEYCKIAEARITTQTIMELGI